jgi:hypothetical protein
MGVLGSYNIWDTGFFGKLGINGLAKLREEWTNGRIDEWTNRRMDQTFSLIRSFVDSAFGFTVRD